MKATLINIIFISIIFVLINVFCFGQTPKSNKGNTSINTANKTLSPEEMRQKAIRLGFGIQEVKIDEVGARSLFDEAIAKGDALSLMWKAVGMYIGMFNYPYNKSKAREASYLVYELVRAKAWAQDAEALYLLAFAEIINANDNNEIDNQVRQYIEASASQGFHPALISVALKKFAENKHSQAIEDLKNLHAKGTKKAATLLGSFYIDPETDEYNEKEALNWIRKGVEYRDPSAMLKLANIYYEGKNVTRNVQEAKKWAKAAYDKGYIGGLKLLAQIHMDTKNQEQVQIAIGMYAKAADMGDEDAAYELGLMYFNGSEAIKKDEQKAFTYFNRAANLGQPNAMAFVGVLYEEGKVVKQNLILARYWINQAEEAGVNISNEKPVAENPFVTIMKNADFSPQYYKVTTYSGREYIEERRPDLLDGLMGGLVKGWLDSRTNQQKIINGAELISNTKIAKTYAATITTNVVLPEPLTVGTRIKFTSSGFVVLGMFGGGSDPNGMSGGAYSSYNIAPNLPHGAVIGRIGNSEWFLIGKSKEMEMKQNGQLQITINDIDYVNNKGYFDVVITLQKSNSSANSSIIDENALKQEISIWYKKAAENGNQLAQFLLAKMYLNGEGIAQNYEFAFEWFKKSAAQGNLDALYHLASMYEQGKGTPRNIEAAILNYEALEKKSRSYNLTETLDKLRSEYLTNNISKVNIRTGKMKGSVFDEEKKYGSVSTRVEINNIGGINFQLNGTVGVAKKIIAFLQEDRSGNAYFIRNNKINLAGKWEMEGKPKWITNTNGETEMLFKGQFISYFDESGEIKNTPYPCTMSLVINKQGLRGTYIIDPESKYAFKGILELNFSDK